MGRKRKQNVYYNVAAAQRDLELMTAKNEQAGRVVDTGRTTTELATEAQVRYLLKLGVSQDVARSLTKYSAYRMIERLKQQSRKKKNPVKNIWEKAREKTIRKQLD